MCGIAGIISHDYNIDTMSAVSSMLKAMKDRGPDQMTAIHPDPEWPGICMGTVRLSINDWSSNGSQPVSQGDGFVWASMNGEIYNWQELRKELECGGISFNSRCDTELIPYLYEKWGVMFPSYIIGPFSIALVDLRNRKLILARDRAGERPLFYASFPGGLLFASSIPAIMQSKIIDKNIDPASLSEYFTFRCVPDTNTILERVKKVAPGSVETCNLDDMTMRQEIYWRPNLWQVSLEFEDKAAELLECMIRDSVKMRTNIESRNKIGTALSGGLDSSTITAFVTQNMPNGSLQTFSTYVQDDPEDLSCIKEVCQTLKIPNYLTNCSDQDILLLPEVIAKMGEPLSAGMIIPSYQCYRLAKSHGIRVLLNGDGSDELFAGYSGRLVLDGLLNKWDLFPSEKKEEIKKIYPKIDRKLKSALMNSNLTPLERYSLWDDDNTYLKELKKSLFLDESTQILDPLERLRYLDGFSEGASHENRMLFLEMRIRLEGFMLPIPDRTCMGNSIEARSPFLDHRIIDFGFALSPGLKLNNNIEKYILRRAIERTGLLPNNVVWRKKHPFAGPIPVWIEKLSPDLAELLFSKYVEKQGYLNPTTVKNLYEKFKKTNTSLQERINYSDLLFAVIVFTVWVELFINNRPVEDILNN